MNPGETGPGICPACRASRVAFQNCSTWNNLISQAAHSASEPSRAYSSGPSRDQSALGGEGIPKIVPRGTILPDPAFIPQAYRPAGAFLKDIGFCPLLQIVPRGTIWNRTALNWGCPRAVVAGL